MVILARPKTLNGFFHNLISRPFARKIKPNTA